MRKRKESNVCFRKRKECENDRNAKTKGLRMRMRKGNLVLLSSHKCIQIPTQYRGNEGEGDRTALPRFLSTRRRGITPLSRVWIANAKTKGEPCRLPPLRTEIPRRSKLGKDALRILPLDVNGMRQERKTKPLGGCIAGVVPRPDICIILETHLPEGTLGPIGYYTLDRANYRCWEPSVVQPCGRGREGGGADSGQNPSKVYQGRRAAQRGVAAKWLPFRSASHATLRTGY